MLISRGTAPEQLVEWAHSNKKWLDEFLRILFFLTKFANFNEF